MDRPINRRDLLLGAAAGALGWAAARASAAPPHTAPDEDPNHFVFSRLKYATLTQVEAFWNTYPEADDRLLHFLKQATNVKVSDKNWEQRAMDIRELGRAYQDPAIEERVFSRPFLFMTGEGDFKIANDEADTFREYLNRGGFLYADDCTYRVGTRCYDHFYQAFIREMRKIQPENPVRPVPHDHEIYHCLFDFPHGAPMCTGRLPNPDMGLFIEDRLAAFLTNGDLHCGWTGRFFTPAINEDCLKMGVNIVVYALTH